MTTWLRVGVEGKVKEQLLLPHATTTTFLIKQILTNHILVIGILATGCRLIASSSIYGILFLPMVEGCPVVTNLVLLPMTRIVYHPITE